MMKNPFKLFQRKNSKNTREISSDSLHHVTSEETLDEENVDIATEALEELSITSQLIMEIESLDEDSQSQSSENSTLALLSTKSTDSCQIKNVESDAKIPLR